MEALYYIAPFVVILYFVIKRSKKGGSGTGTGTGGDGGVVDPVRPPRERFDDRMEP